MVFYHRIDIAHGALRPGHLPLPSNRWPLAITAEPPHANTAEPPLAITAEPPLAITAEPQWISSRGGPATARWRAPWRRLSQFLPQALACCWSWTLGRLRGRFGRLFCALVLVLPLLCGSACAFAPESPEVQAVLQKALTYLDQARVPPRLGARSLVGLALLKGNRPVDHAKIQDAVVACREAATSLELKHTSDVMYDLALALIFLCELDPDQYRSEIQTLMQLMLKWQKEAGGWGYLEGPHIKDGDTSMTQYAALALWTADRSGAYPVDVTAASKLANWLIRTQDPSGGWGYQGIDPGEFRQVNQQGVQQSLSAAGCGSTYVLGDLLRLTDEMRMGPGADGLPSALRIVRKDDQRPSQGPLTDRVDRGKLRSAAQGGDRWFESNFTIEPPDWVYYYIYALERYKSFRELALGREEKEPAWYNEGVEFLRKNQSPDGSWDHDNGPTIDTCFGVLFLIRGTKKSIQKAEAYNGLLRGGRGLPGNVADVTQRADGQIVKTPFQGQAEGLLAILESAGDSDLDALEDGIQVTLSDEPVQRERELERLRRLVSAEEFAVRMAALQALCNTRELDNVPTLIYALGDPDPRIVRQARDALRLLSRKIEGYGPPDDPSEGAKLEAIERWKQWFLTIRPDAQFLN